MINKIKDFLGFVWCLPYTLFAYCIFLPLFRLSKNSFWKMCSNDMLVLFWGNDSVVNKIMCKLEILGITIGSVILINLKNNPEPDINSEVGKRILAEEFEHVRQYRILGIFFVPFYVFFSMIAWLLGYNFYTENYLEIKAKTTSAANWRKIEL